MPVKLVTTGGAYRPALQRPRYGFTRGTPHKTSVETTDPARKDRVVRLQKLAGDLQSLLVEATEPGQVRADEPSLRGQHQTRKGVPDGRFESFPDQKTSTLIQYVAPETVLNPLCNYLYNVLKLRPRRA